MTEIPKTLRSFLIHFLTPYRFSIITVLCLGVFWAIETSLTPYLMKEIIDRATQAKQGADPIWKALWPFALGYLSLTGFNSVSFRLREWLLLKTIPALRKDIWSFLYNYVMAHSYHFFQKNFSGSVATKISDITRSVDEFLTNVVETFLTKILSIIIAFVSMYWVNPIFAMVLLGWCVIFLIGSRWGSRKAHKLAKAYSEDLSLMMGRTVDAIINNMNIRLFSRQTQELRNLQKYLSTNAAKDQKLQKYLIRLRIFQDITLIGFLSVMMSLLVYFFNEDRVSIGDFAFILTLSIAIINGTWLLASELMKLPEIVGRFSQALSTLSVSHEVQDIENAGKLQVKKGKIEFKKVDFCYEPSQPVFEKLTLTIHPGEKVGLVGPSGSGKSTLVSLILRYHDIQGGDVLIDDQDISKVTQSSLRQSISVIPQDVSLFHRTIFDNIKYGNPHATEHEVIQAAKKANAHEFIQKLEKGYKTIAEERGSNLSGGQRQRIAIARAILKNAPILILDEATSALDPVTEREIQSVLDKIMGRKTCIVIAHRLSTLIDMDRIIVFDGGKIIEEGTHKSLLRKKGHYSYLWGVQTGKIDLKS
ncbi:MAG: ABC transporter ATP-binding protein [Alphaproteobacteria bacterium]